MKKTRIIATVGPACSNLKTLKAMINAGVNVCRLNFSFGAPEEHRDKVAMIRRAAAETGKSVAIMQDLQGPKIRVGKLNAPVEVKRGDTIILSGKSEHKDKFYLPTTYRNIAADTEPGKTILMADGRIILQVVSTVKSAREVVCKVINGGTILTGKGINLPYTRIALPALTPKDIEDALFGIELGVDYIALSFVRTAGDVLKLKRLLKSKNADIPVIAKLEKPEALDNLESILDVVDGVMVARGDLADEISFERVPTAQKHIIHRGNARGRLTIVATEMLSSMIENPLPSRAEVSDIANSIIDGADMVMLSNETATGKYPAKAVKVMAAVAKEAEEMIPPQEYLDELSADEKIEVTHAMCLAASFLSHELNERAIAVLTTTGESARILSKYRPDCVIYAATHCEKTYFRMAAYNNVLPLLLMGEQAQDEKSAVRALEQLEKMLLERKLAKLGDRFIMLTGITGKDKNWQLNSIHTVTIDKS